MNELNQAKELNKESKQFRDEARELLAKTTRFNDQANINQRRLALAVSSLLPRSVRANFKLDESDIDNTADVAQENLDAAKQRDIFDIVCAINVLAMVNKDVIHIFTDYSAHVNQFTVWAISVDQDYSEERYHRLISEDVYLDNEGALPKLLLIESNLTELIIETREEAEANAEAKS